MTATFVDVSRQNRIERADELHALSGVRWAKCYADLLDADLDDPAPGMFWRWTGEPPPGFEPYRCPHNVKWAVDLNRKSQWAVRGPEGNWHSIMEALDLGWIRRVD